MTHWVLIEIFLPEGTDRIHVYMPLPLVRMRAASASDYVSDNDAQCYKQYYRILYKWCSSTSKSVQSDRYLIMIPPLD